MKITEDVVASALAGGATNKEARRALRKAGYRFGTSSFDKMAATVRAMLAMVPVEASPEPEIGGELRSPEHRRVKTSARTLVFTCAQNNTRLHEGFWESLMHLVKYKNAELHVARITYNKAGMSANMAKPGSSKASDDQDLWYDERIVPYISDQSVEITPDLIWCGELNILPTRVNPLSTLHTYTRQASGIVPHVKMAMNSIPVMRGEMPRFMYSTGAVTLRNYIQKAAGQVAEFHHVFGALIVEVDGSDWWVRQINADHDGVFFDKTTRYSPEGISHGWDVEALVHGDIHIGKKDTTILESVFANGGVVDQLRPKWQLFHDIVDFTPRNHHNIDDMHFQWSNEAQVPVEQEFREANALLYEATRPWSTACVVVSNHDQAINRWLKNFAGCADPINRHFWLDTNLYVSNSLRKQRKPHPFLYALANAGCASYHPIEEDESFVLSGVEYGLHGHLGPNGSRGSPRNLKVVGKAFTAHTHSAGIVEGVYTVGVYGKLDMDYNKGPSSWSHTFGVSYANGKRALYTFRGHKPWRSFDHV